MSEVFGALKEYFATKGKEKIKEKAKGMAIGGIELYLADELIPNKIREYGYTILEKNLKEYTPIVTKAGIALAGQLLMPEKYEESFVSDMLDLMGLAGVKDAIKWFVDKPAYCVVTDDTHIECRNFESTDVTVYIDGSEVTVASTEGDAGSFTITLQNALTSGDHTLVVTDGKKAFYGKFKV